MIPRLTVPTFLPLLLSAMVCVHASPPSPGEVNSSLELEPFSDENLCEDVHSRAKHWISHEEAIAIGRGEFLAIRF